MNKTEFNATTNKIIEIELAPDEVAKIEADEAERLEKEAEKLAEQASLAAAKQAAQDKLKALGLTNLEIAAITGA